MLVDQDEAESVLRPAFPAVDSREPWAFFGEVGNVYDALSYAWLYWPELFEYHGAVFLVREAGCKDYIESSFQLAISRPEFQGWTQSTWKEWVDSFNRIEVPSLLRNRIPPTEHESVAFDLLARILADTWSARLREMYPQREFSVIVIDDDPDMELYVEVVQSHPDLTAPGSGRRVYH